MTRRSNRSRGTQAVNMGTGLKARSMQSMAPGRSRRKAGSEALEDAVRYVFGGVDGPNTDEYATHPDWTPNGLPFEVRVKGVPLTLDGTNRRVWSADSGFALRHDTGVQIRQDYTDVTDVGRSLLHSGAVGVPFTSQFLATPEQGQNTFNGEVKIDTNDPKALQSAIKSIGAYTNGTQLFHGPIYDIEYIDNSPIQDTDILEGNGTRNIEIPEVNFTGDYILEFDCVRVDPGASFIDVLGGDNSENRIIFFSSGAGTPNDVRFQASNISLQWTGALDNVADGQHFKFRLQRVGNDNELFIDDVSQGVHTGSQAFQLNTIYGMRSGGNRPPAGMTLQNVAIDDVDAGEYVQYRIDEGEGTVIKAYDRDGNEIPHDVEQMPEVPRNFDSDEGWTLQDELQISGGQLSTVGSATATRAAFYALPTQGQYRLTIDVDRVDGDTVALQLCDDIDGANGTALVFRASAGVYEQVVDSSGLAGLRLRFGTGADIGVNSISIDKLTEGTVTPDASWANVPNNNRHYPMNGAYIDPNTGEIIDIIGGHNGQIQNFNPDNLVNFP